jgi:hypothetical protein
VPKENPTTKEIPNLYKRQAIHLLLYGFISGVQWTMPSLTKKEAAEMFLKRFTIAKDDISIEDIITTYNRIHKDAINAEREK